MERKLAAIFSLDMVSFSRLMEADEAGTLKRHRSHITELLEPSIADHHGRVVKGTGDGLLCEFASAVDAVECAAEVQRAMPARYLRRRRQRGSAHRVARRPGRSVHFRQCVQPGQGEGGAGIRGPGVAYSQEHR